MIGQRTSEFTREELDALYRARILAGADLGAALEFNRILKIELFDIYEEEAKPPFSLAGATEKLISRLTTFLYGEAGA